MKFRFAEPGAVGDCEHACRKVARVGDVCIAVAAGVMAGAASAAGDQLPTETLRQLETVDAMSFVAVRQTTVMSASPTNELQGNLLDFQYGAAERTRTSTGCPASTSS